MQAFGTISLSTMRLIAGYDSASFASFAYSSRHHSSYLGPSSATTIVSGNRSSLTAVMRKTAHNGAQGVPGSTGREFPRTSCPPDVLKAVVLLTNVSRSQVETLRYKSMATIGWSAPQGATVRVAT